MKKFPGVALFFVLVFAGCDADAERVFFSNREFTQLAGVWSGTEEITSNDDIASNSTFEEYGKGFSFPVVIQFDRQGRFALWTGNFPTSYDDVEARTCSGVYTQSNGSVRLLPSAQCRALPLTSYRIGRVLPDGITLEGTTNASPSSLATYASVRVNFRLTKD